MGAAGVQLTETSGMLQQRPELIVVADASALAEAAAERLMARVGRASGRCAVALTGGSSPEPVYELLTKQPYRSRLPWDRIHWFWGDDRFVPPSHPDSNFATARRLMLYQVAVPPRNIHPIPTHTGHPDEAGRLYEAELKRFYGMDHFDVGRPLFDLTLMGVGIDGHTASLFPGSASLQETQRWVIGVVAAPTAPFVPRVTLTFKALASAHEMLFIVSGREKQSIVQRVLAGEDLPASRAYCEGDLVWLIDRAALPETRHVG